MGRFSIRLLAGPERRKSPTEYPVPGPEGTVSRRVGMVVRFQLNGAISAELRFLDLFDLFELLHQPTVQLLA